MNCEKLNRDIAVTPTCTTMSRSTMLKVQSSFLAHSRDNLCMAVAPKPLLSLLEALNFAAIKHRDQRRKDPSKTPYINHPIGVAHILATEGGVSDLATLQVQI